MFDLYFCRTKLQLRVANKIKENYKGKYIVLYFCDDEYMPDGDMIIIRRRSALANFFNFLVFFKKHGFCFKRVFISSVDNYVFQVFLKLIKFDCLYTFDDGSFNFSSSGVLIRNSYRSNLRRFILKEIFKIPSYKDILSKSLNHYAISPFSSLYSDIVRGKLLYVNDLFPKVKVTTQKRERITIFVGSCYHEITSEEETLIRRLEDYFKGVKNVIHVRHPRGKSYPNLGTLHPRCNSTLIEDIVCDFLNQGYQINLVGLFSTCFFNLHGMNNISMTVLDSDIIFDTYRLKEKRILSFYPKLIISRL